MAEEQNRLYVGNIAYTTTSEGLKEHFSSVGEVEDAVIVTFKDSGRSKGFGFVTMADEKTAQKAIAELDGKELDGRPIRVSLARTKTEGGPRES